MKVSLWSIRPGGSHGGGWDALVDEYLRRAARTFPGEHRTFRSEQMLMAAFLQEGKGSAPAVWIADLGGVELSSERFAARLGAERDLGRRHLILAVGPADGWSTEARSAAALRISLGPMTLPHELARLVLAEQVYRATAILTGHPYHAGH